jgi:hypothetical protein
VKKFLLKKPHQPKHPQGGLLAGMNGLGFSDDTAASDFVDVFFHDSLTVQDGSAVRKERKVGGRRMIMVYWEMISEPKEK